MSWVARLGPVTTSDLSAPPVEVLGRRVDLPVRVRTAQAFTAMYAVPRGAAQEVIAASGLRVLPVLPGRALACLVFVRYVDNDLGPYDELGVAFLVAPHDRPAPEGVRGSWASLRSGDAGVLIHQLPVDGEFTCAAGREIWGFPKQVGTFTTSLEGRTRRTSLELEGRRVADFRVTRGLPLPAPGLGLALSAYSSLDGVTRVTRWEMAPEGVRSRPGGARLRLGDHPIADELRSLGLPNRALSTTTIANLAMTFGPATVLDL